MGSMGFRRHEGRVSVMGDILNEGYKYLVVLNGTDSTGKPIRGGYELFKKLNEKEIRNYATARAEEVKAKLTKIEVYSLECKLHKEIQI